MKTRLGFEIHDAANDARTFSINEESGGALVFGTNSAVCVSGSCAVLPRKNMTERTAVVPGVSRHRARSAQGPQSRCLP
jgi:hypothetical protein